MAFHYQPRNQTHFVVLTTLAQEIIEQNHQQSILKSNLGYTLIFLWRKPEQLSRCEQQKWDENFLIRVHD